MHTIRRRVEKLKIEAYLVRLSVDRLPVIPGFVRPFANDSLMRMIIGEWVKLSHYLMSAQLTLTRSSSVARSRFHIFQFIHCQIFNIAIVIIIVLIVFIFGFNQVRSFIVRVGVMLRSFGNMCHFIAVVLAMILLVRIIISLFVGNGHVVWWSRGSGGIW